MKRHKKTKITPSSNNQCAVVEAAARALAEQLGVKEEHFRRGRNGGGTTTTKHTFEAGGLRITTETVDVDNKNSPNEHWTEFHRKTRVFHDGEEVFQKKHSQVADNDPRCSYLGGWGPRTPTGPWVAALFDLHDRHKPAPVSTGWEITLPRVPGPAAEG